MIKLQFVDDHSLSSSIIKYYSHNQYVHVDALLDSGDLLGARLSGGVQIRPPEYKNFTRKLILGIPATSDQTADFYDFCFSQIGKPYDWKAILGFALERNWRDDDCWECSEFICYGLERVGIFSQLELATYKITPGDLLFGISVIYNISIIRFN